MNCIVLDERTRFLSDLETRLLIDDERTVNIVSTISSVEKLDSAIKAYNPDTIVICSNIADAQESWDYAGIKVVGYALNEEGEALLKSVGVPSYGIILRTNELLNMMEGPIPKLKGSGSEKSRREEPVKSKRELNDSEYDDDEDVPVKPKRARDEDYEDDEAEEAPRKASRKNIDDDEGEDEEPAPRKRTNSDNRKPLVSDSSRERKSPQSRTSDKQGKSNRDDRSSSRSSQQRTERQSEEKSKSREPDTAIATKRKKEKDKDARKKSIARKAKVVTVYSAKGGVGKTTVATELAVYLSLTSSGRGRLRVCVVDYNIDFGDVRSVLGLSVDGPDMSRWAMDIRERIEDGENPEEIQYSKEEMQEYLQVMEKTGLRALLAPLTHEESMDIGRDELDVMLRNLVHNGGFDFIICDTGNNTRDSSVYALEAADTILLISTQDATAATCNSSSMEALQKYGLDLRKVRMVINNCMSARLTGISVKEVEDAFLYPCIARIPHDTQVIRANNLSVPIVYQAKHEVTAAFRKIVNYLLGKQAVKTEQPKKFSLKSLLGFK